MEILDWTGVFTTYGAFFEHDGNPQRPHVLLTKGGHSSGYFNSRIVAKHPRLLDQVAGALVSNVRESSRKVTMVAGPAKGAITLAHDIARHLGVETAYAQKQRGGGMRFEDIIPTARDLILPCEDTITTGQSVLQMIAAARELGAQSHLTICTIVNRSGKKNLNAHRIVSLIEAELPSWSADECPLCRQGSEAIRPKASGNWERLTQAY